MVVELESDTTKGRFFPRRFEPKNARLTNGLWVAITVGLTFGTLFPIFFVRLADVETPVFYIYSMCMSGYLVFLYITTRSYKPIPDTGFRPYVSVVIPVKNEEEYIVDVVQTVLESDYPSDKLEVIVVNDGSTDSTWERLQVFRYVPRVTLVNHERNFGKRVALATGFSKAKGDIMVCIDSDSFVEREAVKLLVQPFADLKVVATCGTGEAANKDSFLAKLQHYWYADSFRLQKGMESRFGCVNCCSGILSAYRKQTVRRVINEWLNERFAGRHILIGDDRQLTSLVARGFKDDKPLPWDEKILARGKAEDRILTAYALSAKDAKVVYQSNAICYTVVPATWKQFFKQQLRWERAWIHGTLLAGKFMWRKSWPMNFIFYVYQLLTYASPLITIYMVIVQPLQGHLIIGLVFLSGSLYIGFLRGMNTKELTGIKAEAVVYTFLFVFVSIFLSMSLLIYGWLTPWKGGWITRADKSVMPRLEVPIEVGTISA